MKEVLFKMKKMSILILCLSLILAATTGWAAVPYEDNFESWANPNVADGWTSSEFGGGPGDINHIYDSGQGISCGGDGTNYKSVYRDLAVFSTPGNSRARPVYHLRSASVQAVRRPKHGTVFLPAACRRRAGRRVRQSVHHRARLGSRVD